MITDILCILVLAWLVSALIHIIMYFLDVWDKIAIKINLPKSKKYLTKVDPIYELRESSWDTSVYVYKWSLRYEHYDSILCLLLIIIPYPIILKKFGYYVEDSIYLCEREKVKDISEDLKTIYERKMVDINREMEIERKKKNEIENKFDELNQIFKQNYE